MTPQQALITLVMAGHVDHGKSTLLGRLLYELGQLPPGKEKELAALSAKRGVPLEWSFALDSLQAERDQAITLDTTRVRLRTPRREIVVIDAPGHKELLRNMVSGASAATAALLVLDVRTGNEEQTLHHARLLKLLGVRDIAVAINKMDLVDYAQDVFRRREREVRAALDKIGLQAKMIVPVSAREGANVCTKSSELRWYEGGTVLAALEALSPAPQRELTLRIPVQDIYRSDERRVIAGRVESGELHIGDSLIFSPSGRSAKVAELLNWPAPPASRVHAGDNASIVFDRPIIVERGDIASHLDHPPKLTAVFDADVFWLSPTPLVSGRELTLNLATRTLGVRVQSVHHRFDPATLEAHAASEVTATDVARVTLRAGELLALDDFAALPATGRFVLRDGLVTVGGGVIDASGYPDQRGLPEPAPEAIPIRHQVSAAERAARLRHSGAVVWLTGLSAAGKSTLAMLLERRLFDAGYAVFVLDGDNLRRGLNVNLGFSPEDRQENIRRIGEVAALFAEAGLICITAFISPYRDDRRRARTALKSGRFLEVYVKADLAVCEARDPKGLYRKARRGELKNFTGIDSPYEEPEAPEMVMDTNLRGPAACVDELVAYVAEHCRI